MSGNGIDIGAVYGLLSTVATNVLELHRNVGGLRQEVGTLRHEVGELRREVGKKADKDDVLSLRQALTDYHSAVLGHGILITELDMRLRRVEQHLNLPPAA